MIFYHKIISKSSKNQSILITGCDSGFGFILAQDLKENGCDVIGEIITSGKEDKRPPAKNEYLTCKNFRPLILMAQN